MESRQRASPEQFITLLDFMERNGDISRPQTGPQGRIKSNRLWQQLTETLNSTGGGVTKPMEKWKKVWADWKAKTKKKALAMRREAHGTGGGPSSRQSLTALEDRLLGLMGLSAVVGLSGIQERGFDDQPQELAVRNTNIETAGADNILWNLIPIDSANSMDASGSASILQIPCGRNSASSRLLTTQTPPGHATTSTLTTSPIASTSRELPQRRQNVVNPTYTSPTASTWRGGTQRRVQGASPTQSLSPAVSSPRHRALHRVRRRTQTAFERSTQEFVTVEHRRLQLEEERERNLHQRETRRLNIEERQTDILANIAGSISGILQYLMRSSSLPSTDILPNS